MAIGWVKTRPFCENSQDIFVWHITESGNTIKMWHSLHSQPSSPSYHCTGQIGFLIPNKTFSFFYIFFVFNNLFLVNIAPFRFPGHYFALILSAHSGGSRSNSWNGDQNNPEFDWFLIKIEHNFEKKIGQIIIPCA